MRIEENQKEMAEYIANTKYGKTLGDSKDLRKPRKTIKWVREGEPVPADAKFVKSEERLLKYSRPEGGYFEGYVHGAIYEIPLD